MFCLSETLEQLSFTDKISSMPTNNAQKFIKLLNQYFDLSIFIPDESVFSKFKTQFDKELLVLFNNISTNVIQIFSAIDDDLLNNSVLKGMDKTLIYDTTGLKLKVNENNPKYIASAVKKQLIIKISIQSLRLIKIYQKNPMPIRILSWAIQMVILAIFISLVF